MKVIAVRDTPPYGHAPTYHISLTYLERQKSYGSDKLCWEEVEEEAEAVEEEEIRLKQYVSLRSKGRHNYATNMFDLRKINVASLKSCLLRQKSDETKLHKTDNLLLHILW